MTAHQQSWLAHFDEAPVVDFYGIIDFGGVWSPLERKRPYEPEDLGTSHFYFGVWRVDGGEVQTSRIEMVAIFPYKEVDSLIGSQDVLRTHPLVHFKAKVALNPAGYQEALFIAFVGSGINDAELVEVSHQLSQPITFDSPPLPILHLSGGGSWYGLIDLPSWNDFYLQSEPDYISRTGRDAGFKLDIESVPMPDVRLGYRGIPPSPEQVNTYVYLAENDKTVQDALLRAIFAVYSQWREEDGGESEFMPDVSEPQQFQSLLLLNSVVIKREIKDEHAYVYFNLLPNWDFEDGMGAILHRDRVVAFGYHDVIWNAIERDQEAKKLGSARAVA